MENVIIIAVLLCMIGGIVFYLCGAKKRGETCIGCPYSRQCGSKRGVCECGGCCGGGGYRPRKKKLFRTIYQKRFRVDGMHCENCKKGSRRLSMI